MSGSAATNVEHADLHAQATIALLRPQSSAITMQRDELESLLESLLPGTRISRSTHLSELWAGYGHIYRLTLSPSPSRDATYIVKTICPPPSARDEQDEGHIRKMLSYRVEANFYRDFSARLASPDDGCHIPTLHAASSSDHVAQTLVLEDLAIRFPVLAERRGTLNDAQLNKALQWLASFHARSWNTQSDSFCPPPLQAETWSGRGLWQQGGYHYLATRRDELSNIDPRSRWGQLGLHAHSIGLGVQDLAKFLTTSIPSHHLARGGEEALLRTYHRALLDRLPAGAQYEFDDLMHDWQLALVAWVRFLAGWSGGFWGNVDWLTSRVEAILTDLNWLHTIHVSPSSSSLPLIALVVAGVIVVGRRFGWRAAVRVGIGGKVFVLLAVFVVVCAARHAHLLVVVAQQARRRGGRQSARLLGHLVLDAHLALGQPRLEPVELLARDGLERMIRAALGGDAQVERLGRRHRAADTREDGLVDLRVGHVDRLLGHPQQRLFERIQIAVGRLDVALDTRLSGRRLEIRRRRHLLARQHLEHVGHDAERRLLVPLLELAVVLCGDRLVVEIEFGVHLLLARELQHQVRIARLSLADGRVEADDEHHVDLVRLGQQEELVHGAVQDLVVVRLAAQTDGCAEDVNVVATTRREHEHLLEHDDRVARHLADVGLGLERLVERLCRGLLVVVVAAIGCARCIAAVVLGRLTRYVETHFDELVSLDASGLGRGAVGGASVGTGLLLLWVEELHGHLCLCDVAVGEVGERQFEGELVAHEELDVVVGDLCLTPVPSACGDLLGVEVLAKVLADAGREALKVVAHKAVKVGASRVGLCRGGCVAVLDEEYGELVVACDADPLEGGHVVGGDGDGGAFAHGGLPAETALGHPELARRGVEAVEDVLPLCCSRHDGQDCERWRWVVVVESEKLSHEE
ncbi:hypothetical protein L1887_62974 [Cichorium endivia]|nr:hypothetical protein L1887_62974 [Cichorium endivia]